MNSREIVDYLQVLLPWCNGFNGNSKFILHLVVQADSMPEGCTSIHTSTGDPDLYMDLPKEVLITKMFDYSLKRYKIYDIASEISCNLRGMYNNYGYTQCQFSIYFKLCPMEKHDNSETNITPEVMEMVNAVPCYCT